MVRETSIMSYRAMIESGVFETITAGVYEAIKANPGCTDLEISRIMGYDDPNKVRPKRKRLVDDSWVELYDKRPCSITGQMAMTWVATSNSQQQTALML